MRAAARAPRWVGPALAVALGGCAELELPLDAGPARLDALIGSSVDGLVVDIPQDAARPREMAPPRDQGPPADAAPRPCAPGEPLGLCEVCGPDGRPTAPARDETCPVVDCGPLATYRTAIDDQGRAVCEAVFANPSGPNCLAIGRCADRPTPTVCEQRMVGVTVAVADGECRAIDGCEGMTPGEAGPAPAGTACQGGDGVCNERGECDTSLLEQCGDFTAFGELCGQGVHPARGAYCAVGQPAQANQTCGSFCTDAQAACVSGTLAEADGCTPTDEVGCFAAPQGARIVCWCRR